MFILFICLNVALLLFGLFMVLVWSDKLKEYDEKIEIQNKLIESLQNRLDLHKL